MKMTDAMLKQIYAHGRETYPQECFGFLVGLFEAGGTVRDVVRGANLEVGRNDRFKMDEREFLRVERQAEDSGYEIIGFYHSHPDWPAIPSQTDLLYAWEGSFYLITSIHEEMPLNSTVWQIAGDSPRRFVQHPLELVDDREWDDDGSR